jgi:hypothetical protein
MNIKAICKIRFDWVCTWGIMKKCNIPLKTAGTGLSGTQFSTLKSVGINDPENILQKKIQICVW